MNDYYQDGLKLPTQEDDSELQLKMMQCLKDFLNSLSFYIDAKFLDQCIGKNDDLLSKCVRNLCEIYEDHHRKIEPYDSKIGIELDELHGAFYRFELRQTELEEKLNALSNLIVKLSINKSIKY